MKTNENDQLNTKSISRQTQYSIKTPFRFTSMYQAPFLGFKSENNNESDLTELSWLTNNVQLFSAYNSRVNTNSESSLDYLNERNSSSFSNYEPNQIFRRNFQTNNVTDHRALNNLIKNCADEKLEQNRKFNAFPRKIPKKLMKLQTENEFLPKKISPATNNQLATNYKSDLTLQYEHTTNTSWGLNKPQLTLSCLIFMAIQDSKENCLPVRKIYEWIEMNFPFYKYGSTGWKSSIRHNLSFSKCFKKIDSSDDLNNDHQTQIDLEKLSDMSSNKRRAPNSNGTYWTVCPDSKAYLVQALKKSSFWFHNSKYFPHINECISKFNTTNSNLNCDDLIRKRNFKKLKVCFNSSNLRGKQEPFGDEEDSENEEKTDLLRFIEEQQKEICLNSSSSSSEVLDLNKFDSNDLAAAAVLASSSAKLDLSSSSSSLSSAFSLLSSSSSSSSSSSAHSPTLCSQIQNQKQQQQQLQTKQFSIETGVLKNHQNSDLEIEVASTLVGMKFSKTEF